MLFVNAVLNGHDTMLQGLQSIFHTKILCHPQYRMYCLLLINTQVHYILPDGLWD